METMRLGKTKLITSRIGIGGIPLTRPPAAEAARIVRYAIDRGINFVDTAFGYSDSEERIGRGIAGVRDRVIIATKTPADDAATAMEHLATSLRRLGTDYIDLWQLHGISSEGRLKAVLAPGGAYEAADRAVQQGKVRYIGFSSHNVDVAGQCVATGLFATAQVPFNFISDEAAQGLLEQCEAADVGFIGMKPFAGGAIRDVGLAFRWLLQYPAVLPDPGIERVEEIDQIIAVVDGGQALTEADRAAIAGIRAQLGSRFCRQCEYCMPCPQGVIIPGMMYLPLLYDLWPPERFFSWRLVTASVEGAARCTSCGICETKCPYQLPIRDMMREHLGFYDSVKHAWDRAQTGTGGGR